MSIVKMKKVTLVGMESDKNDFLKKLLDLGCVEVSEGKRPRDETLAGLLHHTDVTDLEQFTSDSGILESALRTVEKYSPYKHGLFSELTPVKAGRFFDDKYFSDTIAKAGEINAEEAELEELYGKIGALDQRKASFMPWRSLDIPLETKGTRETSVIYFAIPFNVSRDIVWAKAAEASELAELSVVSEEDGHIYCWAVCHKADAEKVTDAVKETGCDIFDFSGEAGTAEEIIARTDEKIEELKKRQDELGEALKDAGRYRQDLETNIDRAAQEISREETKQKLLSAGEVFTLEGWVPAENTDKLTKLLDSMCCAYEFTDPAKGEDVPTKLKNSKIVEPLNMVTEMYSLPAYGNVDPNPLIFPWFTLFFGIMYGDLGYGLTLLTLGIIGNRLIKKKGTIKYMAGLLVLCGITTSICGILFGSFFGDSIPVFCDLIGIDRVELWSLIDPLEEPMTALIGSVAIGAVHIILGMAIKAYILIRDGKPLDALFDVGSWWLLFAGIAAGALGKGWYVAIAGAGALILTQGRDKPTIIGKLVSGVASLYDITSYLGDVLSYTRLMALMLAGSVIASVVNTLGSLTGSVITFIIVFIIGHLFNMAINIIGTFVHAARLQYLEFFGKFYEEGGRAFKPFAYKTKYTDIVKEEK